jgi:hypothetical protein
MYLHYVGSNATVKRLPMIDAHHLRQQSICNNYDRYGNLGERAREYEFA